MKKYLFRFKIGAPFLALLVFPLISRAGVISDAPPVSRILVNALSFLLQIFGILAIISAVVAGMIYFTAAGSPEVAKKAKNAAKYSVIGILVGLSGLLILKNIGTFFE